MKNKNFWKEVGFELCLVVAGSSCALLLTKLADAIKEKRLKKDLEDIFKTLKKDLDEPKDKTEEKT